jgi:hypothetical protein
MGQLFPLQWGCGVSHDGRANRDRFHDNSACPDHCAITNANSLPNRRTNSHPAIGTNPYIPGQVRTRTDVGAIAKRAIVVHGSVGINNAGFAYTGGGIHDCARHDNRTGADFCDALTQARG